MLTNPKLSWVERVESHDGSVERAAAAQRLYKKRLYNVCYYVLFLSVII